MIDLLTIGLVVGVIAGYSMTLQAAIRLQTNFDLVEPEQRCLYRCVLLYVFEPWITALWLGLLLCYQALFDVGSQLATLHRTVILTATEQLEHWLTLVPMSTTLSSFGGGVIALSVPVLALGVALLPMTILLTIWSTRSWSIREFSVVVALRQKLGLRIAVLSLAMLLGLLDLIGLPVPLALLPIMLLASALLLAQARIRMWQALAALDQALPGTIQPFRTSVVATAK